MKRSNRLGLFVLRFWPLWAAWITVWLLPATRPVARILSDPLREGVREFFTQRPSDGPMPAAKAHPRDFDLQLWHLFNGQGRFVSGDYYREGNASDAQVARLRRQFPGEPILTAIPVQTELGIDIWRPNGFYSPSRSPSTAEALKRARALQPLVSAGVKSEPNNALWWVARAQIEWRLGRHDAALNALERAARCPFYDDKTLEVARHVLRARKRYDAPLFESQRQLLQSARTFNPQTSILIASAWSGHANALKAQGDAARSLRWSGALAAIGDLMQRDPNAPSTLRAGGEWQKMAWRIGTSNGNAKVYAAFAAKNKRPDLARATQIQAARKRAVLQAIGPYAPWQFYNDQPWLKAGRLEARLNWLNTAIGAAASCLFYLGVWWMAANVLLWRGRGAPSSRAARWGWAIGVTLVLAALAGVCGWSSLETNFGRAAIAHTATLGSLSVFAFVGAPLILALVCASVTLWRARAHFAPTPRIDMELALSRGARALLRWFLPIGVAGSLLFLLGGWALWLTAMWRDWGSVDILALLPPDRHNRTGSLAWDLGNAPFPLIYGIFACVLCLAIWFVKWRWLCAPALRPVTHGGLRWWKETLGGAMVALSWLFFVVALASWSLRTEAEARLERFVRSGDLTVIRAVAASEN